MEQDEEEKWENGKSLEKHSPFPTFYLSIYHHNFVHFFAAMKVSIHRKSM